MRILLSFCFWIITLNFVIAQQTSPQSNEDKKVLKEQQSPIKRSSKPTIQQTATQSTPTKSSEADIRAKQLAGLEKNGVNVQAYTYLGLDPLTATPQDYKAAKDKLYHEQPERYAELKKLLQANNTASTGKESSKHVIKKSDYNAMSPDRKATIDAHPERYQIID